ncbi:hypothetical protein [Fusibacter sp. 3D3]|uniref:hypothetical protein n=1 Tax=Fusibacter sp. 3D3 TaxID=1048380 RepID=UPI000853CF55|nr:hypothetical protein [Fusibacter sp. 3D3]GAU79970.1 DUF324 domain-containing protein [Fusibacter sp. 3D3]
MTQYIEIDIELIDNVIVGDFAGQEDMLSSLSYLSGSAIRGALIYKLLEDQRYSEDVVFNKIITNDVIFFNAYKINEGKRGLPAPMCFATNKAKQRIQENAEIYNILSGEETHSDEQRVRISAGDFIGNKGTALYSVKVNKNESLHIKTKERANRESGKKSEMYRIESIEKGQCFRSYIAVPSEEVMEIILSILHKEMSLFIGASRGNGYGHCKIKGINILEHNPEDFYLKSNQHYFYVYYMSDFIYVNQMGIHTGMFSDGFISEKLGVTCTLCGIATETKIITGFNSKIGGRLPQFIGAKMGTVVKYEYTGTLELSKVHEFTNSSYGLRVHEGFGRVAIVSDFNYQSILYGDNTKPWADQKLEYKLSGSDQRVLLNISKSIYLSRLNILIKKSIHKSGSIPLTNSKMTQWQMIFSQMKAAQYQEGIKSFEDLKAHIYKSNNLDKNQKMSRFIEHIIVQGITINDFVLKSNSLECFREMNILPDRVILGDCSYELRDEEIYQWNLYYLEQLLYFKRIEEKGAKSYEVVI